MEFFFYGKTVTTCAGSAWIDRRCDMNHSCVGEAAAGWSRCNTVLDGLHLVTYKTAMGKHESCLDIHET